jgi:hypothetical protein
MPKQVAVSSFYFLFNEQKQALDRCPVTPTIYVRIPHLDVVLFFLLSCFPFSSLCCLVAGEEKVWAALRRVFSELSRSYHARGALLGGKASFFSQVARGILPRNGKDALLLSPPARVVVGEKESLPLLLSNETVLQSVLVWRLQWWRAGRPPFFFYNHLSLSPSCSCLLFPLFDLR